MQLFYAPAIHGGIAVFEEEESRHFQTVLRKKQGDTVFVTDGKGAIYQGELVFNGKKNVTASILRTVPAPSTEPFPITMAVAPVKNLDRFEWFLEKATEIGVREIIPVLCHRSERTSLRHDRSLKILISAMKQSARAHLPILRELTRVEDVIKQATADEKIIAWISPEPLPELKTQVVPKKTTLMLIGPEGDFTEGEAALAVQHGFIGVSLGNARLRTETAGIVALTTISLLK